MRVHRRRLKSRSDPRKAFFNGSLYIEGAFYKSNPPSSGPVTIVLKRFSPLLAAKYLSVHISYVYKLISEKRIRTVDRRGTIWIPEREIMRIERDRSKKGRG